MKREKIETENSNPVVFGVEIWNAKGIQIVLNKIGANSDSSFEMIIESFKGILQYPGMWDEMNIATFIPIFHKIVKKHHSDIDDNITMQGVWKKFEWVRSEQLMDSITITTEDKIKQILESKGEYSHGHAKGLKGVGALSV